MPQPEYPSALRQAGVTGDALIEFTVTTDGTVVGAKVMKATNALFAEAALAAVSRWQFTPAKLNGKPVNRVMQQPITFSLAAELQYLRNR